MYCNLLLLYLSKNWWKKIIYQLRKQLKMYETNQRWKLWARLPIAVSSCPAAAHIYRWNLSNCHSSLVYRVKVKTNKIVTFTNHWKKCSNFGKVTFFQWRQPWSLEIYKLAKFITLIQTKDFQFLSRVRTYLWDIHSLKNNSTVSRLGYLYGVSQKMFLEK